MEGDAGNAMESVSSSSEGCPVSASERREYQVSAPSSSEGCPVSAPERREYQVSALSSSEGCPVSAPERREYQVSALSSSEACPVSAPERREYLVSAPSSSEGCPVSAPERREFLVSAPSSSEGCPVSAPERREYLPPMYTSAHCPSDIDDSEQAARSLLVMSGAAPPEQAGLPCPRTLAQEYNFPKEIGKPFTDAVESRFSKGYDSHSHTMQQTPYDFHGHTMAQTDQTNSPPQPDEPSDSVSSNNMQTSDVGNPDPVSSENHQPLTKVSNTKSSPVHPGPPDDVSSTVGSSTAREAEDSEGMVSPEVSQADVTSTASTSQLSTHHREPASEKTEDRFECSFSESDDSENEDQEGHKTIGSNVFHVTFDMDEISKSTSESSDGEAFLTCSVCGKELPESVSPAGGNEMCNTCKLVRFGPETLKPKKRKGRPTLVDSLMMSTPVAPIVRELVKNAIALTESADASAVRKSRRKRTSTVNLKDFEQESESENETFDDDEDYRDYRTERRKSRKAKPEGDLSKSKYAQELNLAPVLKTEPDDKSNTEASQDLKDSDLKIPSDIQTLLHKTGKRGRPKGSKNRLKIHRLSGAKARRRQNKFNERWNRERGPVPETNPDAPDGMWSCEFCSKAFAIRRNYLAHRRKHSGRHKCNECSETFECNSKLQRHIRRHRGEKPFACHICPKAYSENMWLQRHLATHLTDGQTPQPKPYQCNICGRQYTHKGTMIYHVKTHTETKFYQCDVCGKQFTHRSSLECHIKTHTGEKPFVCEVCGKRFADRSVQLRHTRSHSGVKPYKCAVCEKGFTQSGTLNIHMRMHTSEKPYKCKICMMGFMKRCDLTKHSKSHLGEMLTQQADLITCRVTDNRGADIQKKATQILIDAYGEKKADGTIEIRTRKFEQQAEDQESVDEEQACEGSAQIADSQHLEAGIQPRHDLPLMIQNEIQSRAMEFIALKRQEFEEQGMERMHMMTSHGEPSPHLAKLHPMVAYHDHQYQADHAVKQQIARHVEQHAAERHLLEQVESHVIGHQQDIDMASMEMNQQEVGMGRPGMEMGPRHRSMEHLPSQVPMKNVYMPEGSWDAGHR